MSAAVTNQGHAPTRLMPTAAAAIRPFQRRCLTPPVLRSQGDSVDSVSESGIIFWLIFKVLIFM